MSAICWRTLAVLHVIALPAVAAAQGRSKVSVQGALTYVGMRGVGYEGLKGGVGVEAQLRYNLPALFSIGSGIALSRHSSAPDWGSAAGVTSLLGVFTEPRRVVHVWGSRAALYLAVRAAVVRQQGAVSDSAVRAAHAVRQRLDGSNYSAWGTQFGGGSGLLMAIGGRTNLDVGLSAAVAKFGNFPNGFAVGAGSNVMLRIGLARGI